MLMTRLSFAGIPVCQITILHIAVSSDFMLDYHSANCK